jgi:hypothetical protein
VNTTKSQSWVPWVITIIVVCFLLLFIIRGTKSHEALLPTTVTVSVQHIETNPTTGEVTAQVAVQNHGKQILEFGYGIQIQTPQGWAHTNGNPLQFLLLADADPKIPPKGKRLVSVIRPSSLVPWRVVAVCWEPESETMPKGKSVSFYSPELAP